MLILDFKKKEEEKEITPIEPVEEVNKQPLNNSNIVRNISTDQSEILKWIMDLYNNGMPFESDMTASELKFYGKRPGCKYEIPCPQKLFDVFPVNENITKITPFEKLPVPDESISSIVVDLPFCCSPKTCKSVVEKKEGANIITNRFNSWYPMDEGYENIYWWVKECTRVLKDGGIVCWKMQSTVSGGLQHWLSEFSMLCAMRFGLYVIDQFHLEAKARLVAASKIKKQMHARKYTSTFWVFKKDAKKEKKNNLLNWLEKCETNVYEGKVWELK